MPEEPTPGAPVFDPESAIRLRKVIGRLSRALNESASGQDLTPTQASVLAVVAHQGPIGMARLAELEGINPTMLSRAVGRLDELGLVRRLPHPTDQRAVLAEATAPGQEKARRIREARTELTMRIVDRIPADDAATLLAALPALETFAAAFAAHRT